MNNTVLHRKQLTGKVPNFAHFLFKNCTKKFKADEEETNYVITDINPLNPELNPICYLLALLGAHHSLHVSRIRVKLLTFRLLMSYIYIWSTHS